jgi:SAM-dependent methyltransferase
LLLLAYSAYAPLRTLDRSEACLDRSWPDSVDVLLTQQLRQPLEEIRLRQTIAPLTPIEDRVSMLVQHQYEENPYPRWVKGPVATPKPTLDVVLRTDFPSAEIRSLGKAGAVDLLAAGCGTGQQLLDLPQAISGARVLAVDLSLASICYAKRQIEALGIGNIEFGQADILQLGALDRRFDVIECGGVLHHLGDPEAGWRVLVSLLRPNGLMRIALYSELARQQIVRAQKWIVEHGYGRSASEIRRFRQEFFGHPDQALVREVTAMNDFYTVSECRDLLFHVQEHRFTIPRISSFLAGNDLAFVGFEVPPAVRQRYAAQCPADPAMSDLAHWHAFEQANPSTFAGMYSFWVQKGAAEPSPASPA